MRKVLRARPDEFVVALLTAFVVVCVGVEQAIMLAIVVSILDHLRRGYHPNDSVLVPSASGSPKAAPVTPGLQSEPGIVVYRFAADLYYANTNRFNEEILELVDDVDPKVELLVLDAGAIFDIDYSGGETIKQAYNELRARGVRLAIADILDPVRAELDRYGITEILGADALYDTAGEAVEAFKGTSTG